jgi:hypothetical protein
VLRYGSVRATDTQVIQQVMDGLVLRACIALPLAASGINSDAAAVLLEQMIQADQALNLLQLDTLQAAWLDALSRCVSPHVHALIAGRAVRLLLEHEHWSIEQSAQVLSLACSNPINPLASAEWLEGFLKGSGLLLIMNEVLWQILTEWVASLPDAAFTELLPLLRRTFATFDAGERRQLGQRVANGSVNLGTASTGTGEIDTQRAALVLPILTQLLTPTDGYSKRAVADNEACHDRPPHLNPLPQAGEEANESLRGLQVNQVTQ